MGVLKHLLFWPVTGPLALVDFSVRKLEGVARRELTDDTRIKEELLDLQMRHELGEIDDEKYAREEARILDELKGIREWRRRLGMEPEWGPYVVSGSSVAEVEASGFHADGDDDGAAERERPDPADASSAESEEEWSPESPNG